MSSLSKKLQKNNIPLKDPSKLTGMYRAIVEDNQDPLGIGRVRIRLPMLHGSRSDGVPTSSLPWSSTCNSTSGCGYGSYMVPEVGETVVVTFEDENPYKPICIGSVYGTGSKYGKTYGSDGEDDEKWSSDPKENELPNGALRNTPSKKVLYRSPTGAEISIDEKRGAECITISDGLGQGIYISTNLSSSARRGNKASRDSEGTGIEIKDYQGQKISFSASKEKSSVCIEGTDGFKFSIEPKDGGIILSAGEFSSMQLDKDGNIIVKGKSVKLESDEGIDISSEDKVILHSSSSIDVQGHGVSIGKDVTILE